MTERAHSLERLVGHLILVHPHIVGLATAFLSDQITTTAEAQAQVWNSSGLSELLEHHTIAQSPPKSISAEGTSPVAGAAARSSESMPGPSTLPASLPRATAIQPDQSDVSMDFTDIAFPLVVTKPLVDANLGSSQPFDFRDLPQPVPPPFNPADTALSNRLPQPPVPPAQAPPEFPNTSSEEPFRASLSYAEILGARGDPELVVDFASWNQTDLLFSLGLVSHATHDATAAWLPPPSLPHNMPSLPVSLDPPVPSSQSGAVDPQSQAQPATLGEAALPGMRTSLNGSDDTPTGTPGPGPDLGWAAFSQPFPPTDLVDLWMSRGDLDFSAPG